MYKDVVCLYKDHPDSLEDGFRAAGLEAAVRLSGFMGTWGRAGREQVEELLSRVDVT